MLVHLNGRLVPREHAAVSPLDRGFLFGDGLYEGLRATDGVVIGLDLHIKRMREGLAETRLDRADHPFDPDRLGELTDELLRANGLTEAFVYWQVTRGAPGPGDPVRQRIPSPGMRPTVFGYAVAAAPVASFTEPETKTAALIRDTRWERGHVKGTSMLGNVIAAMEAAELGADDAIFHRQGLVVEGASTNVVIVPRGASHAVTPLLQSVPMLAGVTRALILEADPTLVERPVTAEEIQTADEIMLIGTLTMLVSVVQLDDRPVGPPSHAGRPGPHARRLLGTLVEAIRRDVHSHRRH